MIVGGLSLHRRASALRARAQRVSATAAILMLLAAPVGPSVVRAATTPQNDLFSDAVALTNSSLPYGPVTLDTTAATTEANEPWEVVDCQGDYFGHLTHTVWYR